MPINYCQSCGHGTKSEFKAPLKCEKCGASFTPVIAPAKTNVVSTPVYQQPKNPPFIVQDSEGYKIDLSNINPKRLLATLKPEPITADEINVEPMDESVSIAELRAQGGTPETRTPRKGRKNVNKKAVIDSFFKEGEGKAQSG